MTKTTSLHGKHVGLGAKMGEFAGFEMPLQYSSVKEEVLAVREGFGVFDVSHMGQFFVEGAGAIDFVDYLIPNDFKGAGALKAVYSPLCRDNGTVVDDLIAYKLAEDRVLICVNASNIEKDWKWINSKVSSRFNIKLTNKSDDYSLLAVQGPKTEAVFAKLGLLDQGEEFPYYSIKERPEQNLIMARTGYTGEDGFELYGSHQTIAKLWEQLLAEGAAPCGLVARDVLRLEVCYPLYGHEIFDEVTPLDAGLKWTVKMDKPDFVGKAALADYNPRFQLVKLSLEKGIPREGYEVVNEADQVIGKVSSGTMSVVANIGIAMCLIEKDKMPKDKKLFIRIRNKAVAANYHAKPFVTGGHK